MKLFDANTWIGRWPFAFLAERSAREHAAFLRRHGIARALVSPLDAVFAPEPGPANRRLLEQTRGVPGLVPIPVINPALANWPEELARVCKDRRVRAVRWLPSYHNYRLRGARVEACAAALLEANLRLVLTARLVDERHEYFALRIRPLATAEISAFLERHPLVPTLITGLYRPDFVTLLSRHRHACGEISFVEWDRTVERVLREVPSRQVLFGSHAPFLIAAAGVAKVSTAALPDRERDAVARENLSAFLADVPSRRTTDAPSQAVGRSRTRATQRDG